MADQDQQVFVLSQDTLFRLWLIDKVDSRALTQLQADQLWKRSQTETRFFATYFSVGDDLLLLKKLAQDMRSPLGRVYFKEYGGKLHIVLKGRPGLRRVLTGTRYGVTHAKVINMGMGRAGVAASLRKGGIVSIFLLTAWNIADYVMRDEATLGQLIGVVASDIAKIAVSGAISFAAGAAVVGTAVGTFALGPIVVAVAVGFTVGLALDWIDNHFELTKKLQANLETALKRFEAEVERQKESLAQKGVNAVAVIADKLLDLAVDAAQDLARRQVERLRWRFIPRL